MTSSLSSGSLLMGRVIVAVGRTRKPYSISGGGVHWFDQVGAPPAIDSRTRSHALLHGSLAFWNREAMRARIVEGRDSPWSGQIVVTPFLIEIGGEEYTPLDDLGGIVVEELTQEEW